MRIKSEYSEFHSKTLEIYFSDVLLTIYEIKKIVFFEASKVGSSLNELKGKFSGIFFIYLL